MADSVQARTALKKQAASALTVVNTVIRTDADGRFCLNDLHRVAVAGGEDYKRCQTEHFLRNDSTQALVDELRENGELEYAPIVATAGRYGGTYVCKELVYAYAMWISASFSLKVIRAYDEMVSKPALGIPDFGDPTTATIARAEQFRGNQAGTLSEALRLAANRAEDLRR